MRRRTGQGLSDDKREIEQSNVVVKTCTLFNTEECVQLPCKSNFNAKLALLFKQSGGGGGRGEGKIKETEINWMI